MLFALLNGLAHDDPLHLSLIAQDRLSLASATAAMVRFDTGKKLGGTESELAFAAGQGACFSCGRRDHFVRECPHREAIQQLVNKRENAGNGKSGKWKGKGKANTTPTAAPAAPAASAAPADTSGNPAKPQDAKRASVATSFLSGETYVTHAWLCDTGASSSMSSDRSAFRHLAPDRRPIHLADGKVIWSRGVGSIHFLSECSYLIAIQNILFVPGLLVNLFAANSFIRTHRDSHREVTDYPKRKWINRRTSATEFTATIHGNGLAYLDWMMAPQGESANVSMEELHARLNHLPFSAVRRLIHSRSVSGMPDRVTDAHPSSEFCEDCVNGKLTRVPHTRPVAHAEVPLQWVYSDVHGPVPTRSRQGNIYWVSFIDDHSRFPAIYFIRNKSDVCGVFKRYRAWAENATGHRIGILRDDKGGEYTSTELDRYLAEAGIRREHSIHDTPQQLGVTERLNRTLDEGITTLLSQSGLSRVWWEDAALHFLYGKIQLPSSVTAPDTPHDLFYGKKGSVERLRPFGCLAYVHLQKDQRGAFQPHALQCILVRYPTDYKGWRFWDPVARKEIISDSAIFRESVFPHWQPGLSPAVPEPAPSRVVARPDDDDDADSEDMAADAARPPADLNPLPAPVAAPDPPRLVPRALLPQPMNIPERPRTPLEVRNLVSNFEYHPASEPLPAKRASHARLPGALAEDVNAASEVSSFSFDPGALAESAYAVADVSPGDVCIPLLDAVECVFSTAAELELRSLVEALKRPDAAEWVGAALKEINAHLRNGTWELAQLPPGRCAIGSRWVFKIKRTLEGLVEKYKGRLVAQGFSQVPGVHYGEIFVSTARFAAVRTVIALAAAEDLELEAVDVSTAFLNGDIDKELYMRILEGFVVEGELRDGEDPKHWVVKLLKGLYGIKQGPRLWALKLHSVLVSIGFERIDCDYSVYVYRHGGVKVFMPIHVDDLLIASNLKTAVRKVKSDLAAHFKIQDQGPMKAILGIKVVRDRAARTIALYQPGYIQSILDDFGMANCNAVSTPMEQNVRLSKAMCPETAEEKADMAKVPYREVVGKLLYLAVATHPNISYAMGVLCCFVENPGCEHWGAAWHLLRYLKGTIGLKLVYSRPKSPDHFITYSDADLSGNPDNCCSTGGFAICIGGGAVQWGSWLQPHVSLSSMESE
jgi:transposase InsO family protein